MATTDLLSKQEALSALGKGEQDMQYSTELDFFISAVSQKLVDAVGPVVQGTIALEAHHGGRKYVHLDQFPVVSVQQVVEYDGSTAGTLTAQTNASQLTTDYTVDLPGGRVIRRSSNADAMFPVGYGNVLVSYTAGRYSSTATVDSIYKSAAVIMLKNAWRTFEMSSMVVNEFDVPQMNFPRFIVPNAVKEMLAREWQAGSGIGD